MILLLEVISVISFFVIMIAPSMANAKKTVSVFAMMDMQGQIVAFWKLAFSWFDYASKLYF